MREDRGAALTVTVRLAAALRTHAGGAPCVEVDVHGSAPVTVADVIDAVAVAYPAIGRRVRDESGALRRHVNVFVGADNARDLDDVRTVVPAGTEVAVIPAVSGG